MKNRFSLFFAALPLLLIIFGSYWKNPEPDTSSTDNQTNIQAYSQQKSGVIAEGSGTAVKVLADDRQGRKQQKFIVDVEKRITLLFSNYIDIAPRIANAKKGDHVTFKDEYE